MITKEELEKAKLDAETAITPFSEEFEKVQQKFEELCKVKQKPYLDMLESYYDENLIDKNGVAVKIGDEITNGKETYYIVNRGMQFVFGQMCFNPRVMANRITPPAKKEKHIFPIKLKEFEKVKLEIKNH